MLKKYAGIDVQKWFRRIHSTRKRPRTGPTKRSSRPPKHATRPALRSGFGCGSGSTDARQTWGATFGAFGADLLDAKGNITVESDTVMQAMEYCSRMIQFMPAETVQIRRRLEQPRADLRQGGLIWNPPSAWAVAKRDAPEVAADCWTFPNPRGPKGRLVPHRPYFWGIWKFSKATGAAKEIIEYLSQREAVEALAMAVAGYDIPAFASMTDFKVWEDIEPPKGTIYNYPVRPWHDAAYYIPGSSGPPEIAVQMWNRSIIPGMVARLVSGQSIKQSMDWAKGELEGFIR